MMRFVLCWTLAGFLIPVVIMIITQAGVIYLLPDWLVVAFWPSSIMLMGTMGQEFTPVSYTHLRAHETVLDLVCRLLLETKNTKLIKTLTAHIYITITTLTPVNIYTHTGLYDSIPLLIYP